MSVRHPHIDLEGLVEPSKCEVDFLGYHTYDERCQNTCFWWLAHPIECPSEEQWISQQESLSCRKRLRPDFPIKASCHIAKNPILSYDIDLVVNHRRGAVDIRNLAEESALAMYLTSKGQRVDTSLRYCLSDHVLYTLDKHATVLNRDRVIMNIVE
jgi:hypothetical protein